MSKTLEFQQEEEDNFSYSKSLLQIKNNLNPKYHDLVGILQNLLSFNPYFRMTAYECL